MMMEISDQTIKNVERVLAAIEERRKSFKNAQISVALSIPEEGEANLVFATIEFLSHDEIGKEEIYDWDHFKIILSVIDIETAKNLIRSTFCEGLFILKKLQQNETLYEIHTKINLHNYNELGSHDTYGYLKNEWPSIHVYGDLSSQPDGRFWHSYLSVIGQPLFPNLQTAIISLFNLRVEEDWGISSRVEIIVPDFRARIKKLTVKEKTVNIEIECKEADTANLRVKIFSRGSKTRFNSDDLSVEEGYVVIHTEEEPEQLDVCLLSMDDGQAVDKVNYRKGVFHRKQPVVEYSDTLLLDIILQGENDQVEFKQKLNTQNPYEFLETIVAFANVKGGLIILGVDDKANIKGINKDYSETITNLIHSHIDPPIKVRIQYAISIEGKSITIVEVPEGNTKPYWLKNRGAYVRRGSTDKPISRTEVENLFKNRANPYF
jgi:hypothetical protein